MSDPETPPRKHGCLPILALLAGLAVFFVAVTGLIIWQSLGWLKNAPEERVATYEPLEISEGEREDVNRIMQAVDAAKTQGALVDEYVSPTVFNGVFQAIIEGEKRQGTANKDAPLFVRGSIVNGHMAVKLTTPVKDGQPATPPPEPKTPMLVLPERKYINAEAVFDIEIVDGVITRANVHRLVLRDREAPLTSRLVLDYIVLAQWKKMSREEQNKPDNKLAAVKLLRLEGGRVHIVLDGLKLAEAERRQQHEPVQGEF
ncbi:MAG: hypothetical protein NTW87_28070 [Planctomycetota bacterium]|nr:hypothetical protein [Planctomycetota bacterium]